MIILLNSVTREVQAVDHSEADFGTHYSADWQFVRALGAEEDPAWLSYDAIAGVVALDLTQLDALLHARIDAQAGEARKCYMTAIPDQDEIYRIKEAQARAWLAHVDPDIDDFPALMTEVGATGETPGDAALTIIAAADAASVKRWEIEGARIGAKRAVTAAITAADKTSAAIVDWEGIGS